MTRKIQLFFFGGGEGDWIVSSAGGKISKALRSARNLQMFFRGAGVGGSLQPCYKSCVPQVTTQVSNLFQDLNATSYYCVFLILLCWSLAFLWGEGECLAQVKQEGECYYHPLFFAIVPLDWFSLPHMALDSLFPQSGIFLVINYYSNWH